MRVTNSDSGNVLNRLGFTPEKLEEQRKKPKQKSYNYPYMDKNCIKETIQKAKQAANEYNNEQAEKSKGLRKINLELRQNIQARPHTTAEKIKWYDYRIRNKMSKMPAMKYNHYTVLFNHDNGTNFLMREYKQLKNEIAVTLSYLVFFYAAQIRDNNYRKMQAGVTTVGTLPRLLTNSESLRRFKIEGVNQCPYKNEAILKHVHNLQDAGIVKKFKSHGRNVGFSIGFNSEILVVKDGKRPKSQTPDISSFINYKNGKTPYNDSITRSVLKQYKNKGDKSPERNEPKVSKPETRTHNGNTPSVETPDKNKKKLREKNTKKSAMAEKNKISSALTMKIRQTWSLCQQLEAGKYVNHLPIAEKILREEARNGSMSPLEFRELIFQDFMKYISKLKKENQSAAGAFYRAFEILEHKKLINFAGRIFQKETMVDEYEKWLWMVDHAERWGKKRNWNFLYINDYLDTTRRDAKEVGFWYLEKQWKANERKKTEWRKMQNKRMQEAGARKKKIKVERREKYGYRSIKSTRYTNDYEKARKAVRKYIKQEIRFEELHRYCRHNLSEQIVKGLHKIIKNETLNISASR